MIAWGSGCDIHELLQRQRSPLFDAALAQLLLAYDSDLVSLRLKLPAEAAALSLEPQGSGAEARLVLPSRLPEAARLPQSERSAAFKRADMPVDGALAAGAEEPWALGEGDAALGELVAREEMSHITPRDMVSSQNKAQARFMSRGKAITSSFFLHSDKAAEHALVRISNSVYFESASAVTLLAFCILTAVEMQREGLYLGYELGWPDYRDPRVTGWLQAGEIISGLMIVCVTLFTTEVIFRGVALRCRFFSDKWNWLDTVILSSMAVEAIALRLSIDMSVLNLLRLLRTLRFVRLFKFIQRFQALYFLSQALANCLTVLMWCCLILIAIQTLTAFLINQLLAVFYFPGLDRPLEERLEVFKYFGSFARALLTTFEMAMGNWPVPARVLFENVSEWYLIIFVLHKMTVGLSIIAIINAVFMQETMTLATFDDVAMYMKKRRQSDVLRAKLEKFFNAADASRDGRVDLDEFKKILAKKEVGLWLSSLEFECKDPESLFRLLDEDGSGLISAEEFFTRMKSLRGNARAMDLEQISEEMRSIRLLLSDNKSDSFTSSAPPLA